MILALALQTRLLDAAERHLGPGGESILHAAARDAADTSFERMTYAQLPSFFAAVEEAAPPVAGREPAEGLADQVDSLRAQPAQRSHDPRLPDRLLAATRKHLGPAAEPFLTTVSARAGLALREIDHRALAQLLESIEKDAAAFLGADVAESLIASIKPLQSTPSSRTSTKLRSAARSFAGPAGERMLNEICREALGIELKELSDDRLAELAAATRQEAPRRFGDQRTSAFLDAARSAVTAPGADLRAAIMEFVTRLLGPAGPILIDEACERHGLPFEALTYEHVMWLAGELDAETAPTLNARDADQLGEGFRGLVTGPASQTAVPPERR